MNVSQKKLKSVLRLSSSRAFKQTRIDPLLLHRGPENLLSIYPKCLISYGVKYWESNTSDTVCIVLELISYSGNKCYAEYD